MTHLIVQSESTSNECGCVLCSRSAGPVAGVHLAMADGSGPVCQDCARKRAPSLAALVTLADAAERVGRIGRHTVFPPMTALLELARAADNYAYAAPRRRAG